MILLIKETPVKISCMIQGLLLKINTRIILESWDLPLKTKNLGISKSVFILYRMDIEKEKQQQRQQEESLAQIMYNSKSNYDQQ